MTAMAMAMAALSGISAAMQVASGMAQANTAARQAQVNAQLARQQAAYNETVLRQRAEQDLQLSTERSQSERTVAEQRQRRMIGLQRAAGAAGGLVGGTLTDILAASVDNMEQDLATLDHQGWSERQRLQSQANADIQAVRYRGRTGVFTSLTEGRVRAGNARMGGFTGAFATLANSPATQRLLEGND